MKIAKAIVAGIGGLCTALAPLLADNVIGVGDWPAVISALVIAIGTVAAVWRVPNQGSEPKAEPPAPRPPAVMPPDA